jgi:hypothetical protein
MNNIPLRDDNIYSEIEKLEDYEFRNCIVFEMIIRTSKMQEFKNFLISKLDELFNNIISDKFEEKKFNYLKNEAIKFAQETYIDDSYVKEYPNTQFIDDLLHLFINYILGENEDYINDLLHSYGLNFNELIFYYDFLTIYSKRYKISNEEIENYKSIKYEKESIFELKNTIEVDGEKTDSLMYECFMKEESQDISNSNNELTIKYSRPTINLSTSKYINFKINTKLDKKETDDLINKIKHQLNSKEIIPLSLDDYLDKTTNFDEKNIGNKNIKIEYADLLFLYDYLTYNKSNNISYEYSYTNIGSEDLLIEKTLGYDSLKKKKKTIFDLIEKEQFRTLL